MRVRILKVTVLNKNEFSRLERLQGEKGEFSLGHAHFSEAGKIVVWCAFKAFDKIIGSEHFHGIKVEKNK